MAMGKIKGQATNTCRLYKVGDKVRHQFPHEEQLISTIVDISADGFYVTPILRSNGKRKMYYLWDSNIIGYAN